jgi:AcrR family transcriptional regulator
MADKQTQVIDAAIKLFAEKGFHSTSIQEIADAVGIAKGSMYLYFKSKDDLLLTIYKTVIDRLFLESGDFKETGASPKEALSIQIRAQLERVMEFKDFITMQMREQYIHENMEIKEAAIQIKVKGFNLLLEQIESLYGEDIRPWLYDCTNLFQSMMNSYMGMMIIQMKEFDLQELTDFLLERLDDLAQGFLKSRKPPILKEEDISALMCMAWKSDKTKKAKEIIVQIREVIQGLPAGVAKSSDLLASLKELEEELQKPEPKRIILQAMLTYLLQTGNRDLKKLLRQLQSALTAVLEEQNET